MDNAEATYTPGIEVQPADLFVTVNPLGFLRCLPMEKRADALKLYELYMQDELDDVTVDLHDRIGTEMVRLELELKDEYELVFRAAGVALKNTPYYASGRSREGFGTPRVTPEQDEQVTVQVWKYHVALKDLIDTSRKYHEEAAPNSEFIAQLVGRLERLRDAVYDEVADDDLLGIISDFENCDNYDNLNDILFDLYNWADRERVLIS
jgi:hypothetical protein